MKPSLKQLSLLTGALLVGATLLFLISLGADVVMKRYMRRLPQVEAMLLPEAQTLAKQEISTKIAREQLSKNQIAVKSQYLARYEAVKFFVLVAAITMCLIGALGSLAIWLRVYYKRNSVYVYKIAGNEIVVPEQELPQSTTISLGLITAEQLKQENSGLERAFELYCTMADTQTKWISALGKHRTQVPPQQAQVPELAPPIKDIPVPTFAELLRTELAEGQPMILGFTQGGPRYGSFFDIYSSAVAGESGSGKTVTLLYLICSGLIAEGVRYYEIDPHYPHPKSLGTRTKPLWEAGLMKHATYKDDILAMLREVEGCIDDRLSQEDLDTTPVVLVIDELTLLMKSSISEQLAHVMERISTEGRKCAVYMLASSQTWLASRTGKDSVARDTLTSAYVHRIKPKQANLLLQDKDAADKVKKYVKGPGQVLLCPVHDEAVVCQIPEVTDRDVERVKEIVNGGSNIIQFPVEAIKHYNPTLLSADIIREARERYGPPYTQFYKTLSDQSGVSDSLIKQICLGIKNLTPETAEKLHPFLS